MGKCQNSRRPSIRPSEMLLSELHLTGTDTLRGSLERQCSKVGGATPFTLDKVWRYTRKLVAADTHCTLCTCLITYRTAAWPLLS